MPTLSSRGTDIVDDHGNVVRLRGVNLGGWLVEEVWMMPIKEQAPDRPGTFEIKDHVTLWRAVEQRLGTAAMIRIRRSLRDNWLNESDFQQISKLGFNCVRLPFLCSLLDEPGGWQWLDRALLWARKNHLYVIVDMHGAPGSQSKDHHTGEAGRNEFFKIESNIVRGEQIWATIARRYKNHPEVAGYDLLNEPMGSSGIDQLYPVEDRLYRAIRSVDATRLIFIEDGYTGAQHMPDPQKFAWQHVAYSIHHYDFHAQNSDAQTSACQHKVNVLAALQPTWNVPIYIGEFNLEPYATAPVMRSFMADMTQHGWAWTMWTYKIGMKHGTNSMWGIYENATALPLLKPWEDSEKQMMEKISEYSTAKMQMNAAWREVLAK